MDIETEQNLPTNNTCEPKVQTENDEYPPLTSDLSLETDPDQPTTSNDDSVCRYQEFKEKIAIKTRDGGTFQDSRNDQHKYWKMIFDHLSWSTQERM